MDDNEDIKFSGISWPAEFLAFTDVSKDRIAIICLVGQFQEGGSTLTMKSVRSLQTSVAVSACPVRHPTLLESSVFYNL